MYTFNPSNAPIRVQVINNEPWFVAKDVCDALTIGNSRDAISRLDDDEKGVSVVATPYGEQQMNIVNESGLYNLIFQSRKAEAKAFRKWVTGEVLPSIRKTGRYELVQNRKPNSGWRKRRELFNLETMRLLWLVDSNLMHGDRADIALLCGVSRNTVSMVLNGEVRSPRVLFALYERAMANACSRHRANLYGDPERAIAELSKGFTSRSDIRTTDLKGELQKGGAL